MMETQVKLFSLFEWISIHLSDITEEGFDHWDVWMQGRSMKMFSAPAVEVYPLCSK